MASSTKDAVESSSEGVGTDTAPSLPLIEVRPEHSAGRSATFDGCVEDLRRRMGSNLPILFTRLEDLLRRRLGVAPLSPAAVALTGLVAVGSRLALALLATALVSEWTRIPWGRWAVILGFFGLFDATQPFRTPPLDVPPGARVRRWMDDWLALVSAIVRESDVKELAEFVSRWARLPRALAVGGTVAAIMLGACWVFTPTAMGELPAGSIVLLALLLYEFGVFMPGADLLFLMFMAREARYEHHLFWPSPADSPRVRRAMRMTTFWGFAAGLWVTLYLVLTVTLVSLDSPLVLPLGVGFMVFGYLATIGRTLGLRTSIQKIIERIRDERLRGLQHQIDAFGPRYADLSIQESKQLEHLLRLHDYIRGAPTTPTTTHTLARTAAGLLVPTVVFIVTVFGEVSAERILDAILP